MAKKNTNLLGLHHKLVHQVQPKHRPKKMINFKYLVDRFPESKDHAEDLWQQICSSLAPENLHEDGELSEKQTRYKLYDIHHDAQLLAKTWPCPQHIADRCDDDISMYVRSTQ